MRQGQVGDRLAGHDGRLASALNGQIRQAYFLDTPDKHGVVVRARRVQQRADDSVVNSRPVVPNELPDGLGKAKNLVVEVDAMPGGYVCSASFKRTLGTPTSRRWPRASGRSASCTPRNGGPG
jgi:hypothetical protein